MCGSVAYVSQSAYIFNGTLEKNVLFGRERDEQRYVEALHAAALLPDLKLLSNGISSFLTCSFIHCPQMAKRSVCTVVSHAAFSAQMVSNSALPKLAIIRKYACNHATRQ